MWEKNNYTLQLQQRWHRVCARYPASGDVMLGVLLCHRVIMSVVSRRREKYNIIVHPTFLLFDNYLVRVSSMVYYSLQNSLIIIIVIVLIVKWLSVQFIIHKVFKVFNLKANVSSSCHHFSPVSFSLMSQSLLHSSSLSAAGRAGAGATTLQSE